MKRVIETAKEVLISVKKNPLDIKLLLLFSTLMTFASTYIHLESNKDLYETIIPYTGWSPGYFFMFIVFIIIWSYTIKNQQRSKLSLLLRGYFILTFGVHLFRGISDWHNVLPEDFTNTNPYLRYDSFKAYLLLLDCLCFGC